MIDINQIIPVAKDVGIIIATGVFRSFMGWVPKALEDNKIERFEWKQLAQTTVRVGTIGVMAYVGFSISGVDNSALASAVSAFFVDKVFNAMKL